MRIRLGIGPPTSEPTRDPAGSPTTEVADTQPLIDKFGRRHSIHVLATWSPRALEAMGVRPVNTISEGEEPTR